MARSWAVRSFPRGDTIFSSPPRSARFQYSGRPWKISRRSPRALWPQKLRYRWRARKMPVLPGSSFYETRSAAKKWERTPGIWWTAAAAPPTASSRKYRNYSRARPDESSAATGPFALAVFHGVWRICPLPPSALRAGLAETKASERYGDQRRELNCGGHGEDSYGLMARRKVGGAGQTGCYSQPRL